MTFAQFALRSLRYHGRTNIALALGFAAVVATLGGALLVGDSVRASLARLVDQRLGRTQWVLSSVNPFGEHLAADLSGVGMLSSEGVAAAQDSGRRATHVQVYGVDESFWQFHGLPAAEGATVSPALARELGARAGETILVRVEKPAAIPRESLHGRKDDVGRTLRVRIAAIRPAGQLGEFSLRPQQGPVRAVFLPLRRLQRDLGIPGKVNTVLLPRGLSAAALKQHVSLDDLGIHIREAPDGGAVSIESASAMVSEPVIQVVRSVAPDAHPVFSYLANSIQAGGRTVPYSLITGVDAPQMPISPAGIVLNQWAARDLNVRAGETVTLKYYVWGDGGTLLTRRADFQLDRVVPISGLAADRQLAPEYPGITEAKSLHDWDPPFPMNLGLIRPIDERYWNEYRTTPKAFIAYETARRLWSSRFGAATSVRVARPADIGAFTERLRTAMDTAQAGLVMMDARTSGREASRGSTDFGTYFAYFSFFVLGSALILAGLLFRLSVEQRVRDVGMLRALGWPARRIASVLLAEGALVAGAGCALGSAAAVAYCALVLWGLRTWWQGAVGTTALRLSISPLSLTIGAAAGFVMALAVMWWSLRVLGKRSPRALMAGSLAPEVRRGSVRRSRLIALAAGLLGVALLLAGAMKAMDAAGAFFGGASLLLMASLLWIGSVLRRGQTAMLALDRNAALWKLGARSTAFRPGRAVAGIALIASATFLIVGIDAFRQETSASEDPHSGTGGFALVAESELPVFQSPTVAAGGRIYSFRLKPGDDASCLNLYQPRNPRVLGAPEAFLRAGRFRFAADRDNPWLLLERDAGSGPIPAIADGNSIAYILHKKVGDELVLNPDSSHPVRLKLVAALAGSTLQSELVISERNFIRAFPQQQGYRFFLIDAPPAKVRALEAALEDSLSDFGFDAMPAADRLAAYRQVENTYLSTFQALGALGLLLGTVGLAALLLRNVLERSRELAVLRALGYRRSDIGWTVITENLFIAATGLVTGGGCAMLAVLPTVLSRGGRPPTTAVLILIVTVPLTALLSSFFALRAAGAQSLLAALRSE